MKEFDTFVKIAKQYKGKITRGDTFVYITNDNEICSYYESGEICQKAVVPCKVGVKYYEEWDSFSLRAEEKTYSIIGVMSTRFSEDALKRTLKLYNFPFVGQIDIFDLL